MKQQRIQENREKEKLRVIFQFQFYEFYSRLLITMIEREQEQKVSQSENLDENLEPVEVNDNKDDTGTSMALQFGHSKKFPLL